MVRYIKLNKTHQQEVVTGSLQTWTVKLQGEVVTVGRQVQRAQQGHAEAVRLRKGREVEGGKPVGVNGPREGLTLAMANRPNRAWRGQRGFRVRVRWVRGVIYDCKCSQKAQGPCSAMRYVREYSKSQRSEWRTKFA